MATTGYYIDPESEDGDGTTDGLTGSNAAYVSINSFELDRAGTIGAGDKVVGYACQETATEDTSTVDIGTDWDIADVEGLEIRSNDTEDDPHGLATKTCRHNGDPNSGYRLNVAAGFATALTLRSRVLVRGIVVETTAATSGCTADSASGGFGPPVWENCIFVHAGSSSIRIAVNPYRGTVRKCLIIGGGTGIYLINFSSATIEQCGIDGCIVGISAQDSSGTAPIVKNTWVVGCTTDYEDRGIGWNAASATNATDSASGTGKPAITQTEVATSEFNDYGNNDYSLASGASQLKGTGTDLSGTFATDIIGNAFGDDYDIGPFAFVDEGGGGGRIMGRLAGLGGLAGHGGLAGQGGGLAG